MSDRKRPWRRDDGLNLAGYFQAESGVGEHARTLLEALDAARIPLAPVPFTRTRSRLEELPPGTGALPPWFGISLVCVNADQTPLFLEERPDVREGRHVIGYWHWEVDDFPPQMAASARLVDEIWTASEHSRVAIAKRVDRPVHVFHPAVSPPAPAALPEEFLPPGEGTLFLTCFDFDSIVERKNPGAAIAAYERAFPDPRSGSRLLVKSINGHLHPEALAALRARVGDRPDIRFEDRYLTRREQSALLAACDVFVSLHRAEGFGLMLAEAMTFGRLVIATDYSGSRDFFDESCGVPIPWSRVAIPSGCGPYSGTWAEPDVASAAAAMRSAAADRERARTFGEVARRRIREQLSPAARGAAALSLLERIPVTEPEPVDVAASVGQQLHHELARLTDALGPDERAAAQRSGWGSFFGRLAGRTGRPEPQRLRAALREAEREVQRFVPSAAESPRHAALALATIRTAARLRYPDGVVPSV